MDVDMRPRLDGSWHPNSATRVSAEECLFVRWRTEISAGVWHHRVVTYWAAV